MGSVYGFPGDPTHPLKLINLNISNPFGVCAALGNILTSVVSNSHFGKRPVAPMLPKMYILIVNLLRTRTQGHLQSDLLSFITAMWMRNLILCVPPTEVGIW